MPKLTDIRDKFKAAVLAHDSIVTFHSGIVNDVERLIRKEFPIFVIEPPQTSTISGYRKMPFESYDVTFWIIKQQRVSDTEDDIWQKLEDLKDWGHDIIDAVISRSTPPSDYELDGDVRHDHYPYGFTDGTVAVQFTLTINVADCRNI